MIDIRIDVRAPAPLAKFRPDRFSVESDAAFADLVEVTPAAADLPRGSIDTVGYAGLKNRGEQPIMIGPPDGDDLHKTIVLLPGQSAIVPVTDGTLRAKTDTATSSLYMVLYDRPTGAVTTTTSE